MKSTLEAEKQSTEKRDPGFIKIRRGLREHLRSMSSNAVKLYLELHFSASWKPSPNRGWVDASCEDMARALGWSTKTLQRTLKELMEKPYIEVELAANQYELTRIRILKYDAEGVTSALDKFVQSNSFAVDSGVDSGVDKSVQCAVHSNPLIAMKANDLEAPKKVEEVKKEKKEQLNAVRRPFDAELRVSSIPKSPSGFKKNQNLERHLAEKIRKGGDSYAEWIESYEKKGANKHCYEYPFGAEQRAAFEALQYKPDLTSPLLSISFVEAVVSVWEDHGQKDLSAGILCSKVIDYCQTERKREQALAGEDGEGYYYPPDFVEHRNRLRERERVSESQSKKLTGVRA